MADSRPILPGFFATFGVAALVSPRGESAVPIVTTIIVEAKTNSGAQRRREDDSPPAWDRLETAEDLKEFSFIRAEVPDLPEGSDVVLTEGVEAGAYRTDRVVHEEEETYTVRVAKVPVSS